MSRARAVRKSRESEERDGDGDARDGRDCSKARWSWTEEERGAAKGGWCCCVVVVIVCLVDEDDAVMLGREWYAWVVCCLPDSV